MHIHRKDAAATTFNLSSGLSREKLKISTLPAAYAGFIRYFCKLKKQATFLSLAPLFVEIKKGYKMVLGKGVQQICKCLSKHVGNPL